MTASHSSVGRCPVCATALRHGDILIEYQTTAGPRAYAACPDCGAVIHPG